MTLLQHHVLALGLTALTTLCLGLLVFVADPRKRLNQVFGLYSLSISWWAVWELFAASAVIHRDAVLYTYLEWPGVIFIGPTFLHTVLLFTKEKSPIFSFLLRSAYASSFVFLISHLFFNGVAVSSSSPTLYTKYFSKLTPFGLLIAPLFFLLVNLGLWRLRSCCRRATGKFRLHLKYLFWASLIGYLGGSPDWLLVFGTYIPAINPFGIYAVPLYSIATSYAVFQHRLFDINLVIRKSLIYSLVVTILTVGYFGTAYGVEKFFQLTLGYQSVWLSLTAFALMAFLFQPLKIGIQRFVDWLLFRAPQEEMVRRIERLEQEAQQTEKLRAVATLATGLCHELRNPLQVIQTHSECLPERFEDPAYREKYFEIMRTEVKRINNLLRELMDFAKPKPPSFQLVQPHHILDSTADLLSNECVKSRIELEKRYDATGVQISADPDQFRQVILNLILNAMQAVGQNGRIAIMTRLQDGHFILEVADSGPGIDPKILSRLFEPFATTKTDGTGLGLSIADRIIREHGGEILVQNRFGGGAKFVVKLPVAP